MPHLSCSCPVESSSQVSVCVWGVQHRIVHRLVHGLRLVLLLVVVLWGRDNGRDGSGELVLTEIREQS